jgi:hypothetical protein
MTVRHHIHEADVCVCVCVCPYLHKQVWVAQQVKLPSTNWKTMVRFPTIIVVSTVMIRTAQGTTHLLPESNNGYGAETDQAVQLYPVPKIRKRRA